MNDLLAIAAFVTMVFSPCLVAFHIIKSADANLE
jgi:hypothetical protein